MKLVLGIESVGERRLIGGRQQITPDLRFTCDGLITSWIIGGDWNRNNTPFPELQVWRNIGNDTYQKIHGTIAESPTMRTSFVYVYSDFQPIPVLAGDILGIFLASESRDTCSYEFKCSYTSTGKLTPISCFIYLCSYSIRIYNYR